MYNKQNPSKSIIRLGRLAGSHVVGTFIGISLAAGLLISLPAEAQLLKGLLNQLGKDEKKEETNSDETTDKKKVTASLSDGTGGNSELEAVALIEDISNASSANVEAFDTVARGQEINLGRSGKLTLSYSTSCLVEKITGGRVKVAMNAKTGGSIVTGGKLSDNGAACQKAQAKKLASLVASSKEGAVVVPRLETPFGDSDWNEKTVALRRPYFVWPKQGGGRYQVSILYLDEKKAPKVLWSTRTTKNKIRYPSSAKSLKTGMPHALQVTYPNGTVRGARFNIDLDLDAPKNFAGRAVFITKPKK